MSDSADVDAAIKQYFAGQFAAQLDRPSTIATLVGISPERPLLGEPLPIAGHWLCSCCRKWHTAEEWSCDGSR